MEENELKILSQLPRQCVPDHVLNNIKSKLYNEASTSWVYKYAAAAIIIIICNVSMIAYTQQHTSVSPNNDNPFTISNDINYE